MAYRFAPVQAPSQSNDGLKSIVAKFNNYFQKLDREAVTKIVNGANGSTAILFGMRPDGTFGIDFSDSSGTTLASFGQVGQGFEQIIRDPDGVAKILLGSAPNDARAGFWMTKDGYDLITELEG